MDAETPVAGNWLPDDGSAQCIPPGSDGAVGAGREWGQAVDQELR
jgi:hypothetical protein